MRLNVECKDCDLLGLAEPLVAVRVPVQGFLYPGSQHGRFVIGLLLEDRITEIPARNSICNPN